MTAQNFENVFQKISLSLAVQEVFQGTEVRKLTIHKKERTVSMEVPVSDLPISAEGSAFSPQFPYLRYVLFYEW